MSNLDPTSASAATVLVAVDARSRDHAAAEHLLHHLEAALPPTRPAYVASTHVVADPEPHIALALSWEGRIDPAVLLSALAAVTPEATVVVECSSRATRPGVEDLLGAALAAAEQHRTRRLGRLVRFPGQHRIEGAVTVAEVVERSCVDEVRALAGTELTDDSVLDLSDFARPTWASGTCILAVQNGSQGLIPFEVREQIACCSDH